MVLAHLRCVGEGVKRDLFVIVCLHVGASGHETCGPATVAGRRSLAATDDQLFHEEQELLFLDERRGAMHDHGMDVPQRTRHVGVGDHGIGESEIDRRSEDVLADHPCRLDGDVEAPVVQRLLISLRTGMSVARVEQRDVALLQDILLSCAGKVSVSCFDVSDDIVVVEMVGERLDDPLEMICLDF